MRNRSEDQIALVMIRHGATRANKERRYLGKTEEALSEEGKRILLQYKKENVYPKADILFSGPMVRCMQTAAILYPNLRPVRISEWTEMDFGAFEYKNYEELKSDMRYQQWLDTGGTGAFPGGESREDFILRCKKGFERMQRELGRIRREAGSRSPNAALIVHSGTMMALLSTYYGGDYFDYQVPNGKGYVCMWQEGNGISEITALRGWED